MATRKAIVGSKVGLHARPASLFVQAAARQPLAVTIAKDGGDPVPANSILSVIGLDVRGGDVVVLSADGEAAETVLDELVSVVETDHDA